MKKTILFFVLVASTLFLASCSMFGNKISVDPAEIYKNYSEHLTISISQFVFLRKLNT